MRESKVKWQVMGKRPCCAKKKLKIIPMIILDFPYVTKTPTLNKTKNIIKEMVETPYHLLTVSWIFIVVTY
jgi:hypothetical protein